jgi:hypothetical protein
MTWTGWFVFPLFVLLLLAAVPVKPCRVLALRLLKLLLEGALLVGVGGCLLFHCNPDLVPGWVRIFEPVFCQCRQDMPLFAVTERLCGSPWLLVAFALCGAGLVYRSRLGEWIGHLVGSRKPPPPPTGTPGESAQAGPRWIKDLLDL